LYKGRRYWIFENDTRKPFDEWTGDYKILAYDRTFDALVACGNWKSDGSIDAGILWGQGVSFEAVDLRDMVQQIYLWINTTADSPLKKSAKAAAFRTRRL
jgi:hypothetical protein